MQHEFNTIDNLPMGPSIKDIRFFGPFFDLPTHPYPIISDFGGLTQKRISDLGKPTF